MARRPSDYDDDDVPWLAEGVREPQATMVPRARLLGGGIIVVLLAVLVVLGVYLAVGHKSDGSTGYANPADAPLIAADAGPVKVRPADPGGAQITGIDDTLAAAAGGNDVGSSIAPETIEEPLARPGTPEAANAPPPTDLLPATIPPTPTRPPAPVPQTIAPAPVVAPPAAAAAPKVTGTPSPKVPAIVPPKPTAAKSGDAKVVARPAAKTDPASDGEKAKAKAKLAPATDDGVDPLAASPAGKADVAPRADKRKPDAKPKSDATPDAPVKAADDAGAPAKHATLQLGAFSTRDKAEAAWAKAGGDGALSGLSQRIEAIERDGKTLYRLRAAGVPSKAAAAALCGRVHAAGNACIVAE